MNFAFFYHSLLSDWNHGNAHFLRGVIGELLAAGHQVRVYEPAGGWSLRNLVAEHGTECIGELFEIYPRMKVHRYGPHFDLERAVDGADVVLVHEWNDPELVAALGACRERRRDFTLFFHDTHHRAVTAPEELRGYDLRGYDGVLAFGRVIRDLYLEHGWAQRAWTWHEAADIRVFYPRTAPTLGDLVWIGNWGDDERSRELREFLLEPVAELGLDARAHGVRYPEEALRELDQCGIEYHGWVANYRVPELFATHRVTVHIPRGPYVRALPGIPTIRPFEAMSCGIPLVCSPWEDTDELFEAGVDYLVARDGDEMRSHLRDILEDADLARALAESGRRAILKGHTCGHRVDELLTICDEVRATGELASAETSAAASANQFANPGGRELIRSEEAS